jgi:hypothetical protein
MHTILAGRAFLDDMINRFSILQLVSRVFTLKSVHCKAAINFDSVPTAYAAPPPCIAYWLPRNRRPGHAAFSDPAWGPTGRAVPPASSSGWGRRLGRLRTKWPEHDVDIDTLQDF